MSRAGMSCLRRGFSQLRRGACRHMEGRTLLGTALMTLAAEIGFASRLAGLSALVPVILLHLVLFVILRDGLPALRFRASGAVLGLYVVSGWQEEGFVHWLAALPAPGELWQGLFPPASAKVVDAARRPVD